VRNYETHLKVRNYETHLKVRNYETHLKVRKPRNQSGAKVAGAASSGGCPALSNT